MVTFSLSSKKGNTLKSNFKHQKICIIRDYVDKIKYYENNRIKSADTIKSEVNKCENIRKI